MAGVLESIGRSNLSQEASKLSDMVLKMRADKRAEEQQGFSNRMAEEGLALQKESSARDESRISVLLAEEKRKQGEYDQEQKFLGQVRPVKDILANYAPETQNFLKGLVPPDEIKQIGGVETVTNRGIQQAMKMYASNASLVKTSYELELSATQQQIGKIEQALQSGELKGKDAQAAQQQLAGLKKKAEGQLNTLNIADQEIRKAKEEHKMRLEEEAQKAKLGIDKEFAPHEVEKLYNALTGKLGLDKDQATELVRDHLSQRKEMSPIEFARQMQLAAIKAGESRDTAKELYDEALATAKAAEIESRGEKHPFTKGYQEQKAVTKESTEGKQLTADDAKKLLKEVGGDKAKARELAKRRGYKF